MCIYHVATMSGRCKMTDEVIRALFYPLPISPFFPSLSAQTLEHEKALIQELPMEANVPFSIGPHIEGQCSARIE